MKKRKESISINSIEIYFVPVKHTTTTSFADFLKKIKG